VEGVEVAEGGAVAEEEAAVKENARESNQLYILDIKCSTNNNNFEAPLSSLLVCILSNRGEIAVV
jgi:hypothetical protein